MNDIMPYEEYCQLTLEERYAYLSTLGLHETVAHLKAYAEQNGETQTD